MSGCHDSILSSFGVSTFPGAVQYDSDSVGLADTVQKDLGSHPLACDEQLNLIGYSGGASVALNAAALLENSGTAIDNAVTVGGYYNRGKPGNVGTLTRIVGDLDPLASVGGAPDRDVHLPGVGHYPVGFLPSYLSREGERKTLAAITSAGLR